MLEEMSNHFEILFLLYIDVKWDNVFFNNSFTVLYCKLVYIDI